MTDCKNAIYFKNKTELLRLFGLSPIYKENQTGKLRDRLYRPGLHQNRNWIVGTYLTKYGLRWKPYRIMTWSIIWMRSTSENEIELPWLIRSGRVCDENQIGQQYDRSYSPGLRWNQNWTVEAYQIECGLKWKLDKIMMWAIVQVRSNPKITLNCHDWSDRVLSVIKTK